MPNSDKITEFHPAAAGLLGAVRVPADKSVSHRAAMVAAVSDGPVEIKNFLRADDTNATLRALAKCGIEVENLEEGDPVVHGAGLRGLRPPAGTLDIGNSGTSIRLLPGLFAGQSGTFILDGDASIRRRPMGRVVEPLKHMGVDIEAAAGGVAPLRVTGGPVHAIRYEMPVASAQVKSAVLLAGLYADGPTAVVEPAVCRDHTEIMLKAAGARVEKEGLTTTIHPPGRLHLDSPLTVVSDFSSAAFFMVAAAVVPGSDLTIESVGVNPTRTGLIDIMNDMGANIVLENLSETGGEPVADIRVRQAPLRGTQAGAGISGRAIDELPLVALLGAFAGGDTSVSGAAELKLKESDRIAGLAANLAAIGVDITATSDGFTVRGGAGVRGNAASGGGLFKSMGDHRMAMLGAISGLASLEGVKVAGFGCVAVSFPDFPETLTRILP